MLVSDIFSDCRMDLNDNDATIYSDRQLFRVLNRVIAIIKNKLSADRSSLLIKEKSLLLNNNCSDLPADFQNILRVFPATFAFSGSGEGAGDISYTTVRNKQLELQYAGDELNSYSYQIIQNKVYSNNICITVVYEMSLPKYVSLENEINLPEYFYELIVSNMVKLLLSTDLIEQEFISNIETQIAMLTGNRDISVGEDRIMPFIIGGW